MWQRECVRCSRQQCFLDVSPQLFSHHDDDQLGGQLNQTAPWVTLTHRQILAVKLVMHTQSRSNIIHLQRIVGFWLVGLK